MKVYTPFLSHVLILTIAKGFNADVAESVDALDLKFSVLMDVRVRVPRSAPNMVRPVIGSKKVDGRYIGLREGGRSG